MSQNILNRCKKDHLSDTMLFLDTDAFMVSVLIQDNIKCIEQLDRPCKVSLAELKTATDILLEKLDLPRFEFKETEDFTSNNHFIEHVALIKERKSSANQDLIDEFLKLYFFEQGVELDLQECNELNAPSQLEKTDTEESLSVLINALHARWQTLYKRNKRVGEVSTRIFLPNPFVVPGGRFQEFFYWDTWFVIEGLVASGLKEIATNMLKNCIFLIETVGFIPNGTREYYRNRTQPPFFCSMLESLLKFDDDGIKQLVLTEGLEMAIKEMKFFENEKRVSFFFDGKEETLFRYYVDSDYPRFESFLNDIETYELALENHQGSTERVQSKIFSSIKSAAESGIDFSSRWFGDEKHLYTIETIDHIPVDLNGLIWKNLKIISKLYELKEEKEEARKFGEKAAELEGTINRVLWNSDEMCWNDYNYKKKIHISCNFFPSNLYPLLFGMKAPVETPYLIIQRYEKELFGYVGGVPASGAEGIMSGQQWDFPNVWAPYVYLLFQYLDTNLKAERMAFHVAMTFFKSVKGNFEKKGIFYEKYCASDTGQIGEGGEYPNQDGFGWTNAVTLCIIKRYGNEVVADFNQKHSHSLISAELTQLLEEAHATPESEEPGTYSIPHELAVEEIKS